MTETIPHPNDERLTFETVYHPAEKKEGEWNYSLGSPPRAAWYEITAVSFNDGTNIVDITDFVNDYCPDLMQEWEQKLIENE